MKEIELRKGGYYLGSGVTKSVRPKSNSLLMDRRYMYFKIDDITYPKHGGPMVYATALYLSNNSVESLSDKRSFFERITQMEVTNPARICELKLRGLV